MRVKSGAIELFSIPTCPFKDMIQITSTYYKLPRYRLTTGNLDGISKRARLSTIIFISKNNNNNFTKIVISVLIA